MGRYILRRLVQTIPVLFGVSLVVFTLTRVIPGDPVRLMFGEQQVSDEVVQQVRRELGLNLPLPLQYLRFLLQLIQGDLGQSLAMKRPVAELVLSHIPATLELGLAGLFLALAVAVPLGILSAVYRGSLLDKASRIFAVLGVSIPSFWLGIILIITVSVNLRWLPGFGRIGLGVGVPSVTGLYLLDAILAGDLAAFRSALSHLALPAITLAVSLQAFTTRLLRISTIEAMSHDFVTTARAKGLRERHVIIRHAVRNALLPSITMVGLQLGRLVGGAVVTETIFSWPGLGRLVVQSISARDFAVVQGAVLMFALVHVSLNLTTDLAYAWADPRIRFH